MIVSLKDMAENWINPMVLASLFVVVTTAPVVGAGSGLDFRRDIQPVLTEYCYDCHADGAKKGDLELDKHKSQSELLGDHKTWLAVWENLRAQMMPPAKKAQPSARQRENLMRWIERDIFKVDPDHPDPGRVTIRRLNRVEYGHTIRDLLGINFDANDEFPADDTGYGFDTIGDVLSISPLLMEKYLSVAEQIVAVAVPTTGPRPPTYRIEGRKFDNAKTLKVSAEWLPFENHLLVEHRSKVPHAGRYRVQVEFRIGGSMEASIHTATLAVRANGKELERESLGWDNRKSIILSTDADLKAGDNTIGLEIIPGNMRDAGENPLRLAVKEVSLQGPLDGKHLTYPKQYLRIFPDGPPPDDLEGRKAYARNVLGRIAGRAFRRPIDEPTLARLVDLAIAVDQQPDVMFEKGIGHAITAILASPRFLFRAEIQPEPNNPGNVVNVDEFALASRLSYFLWSSLPDEQLLELAGKGELRKNLRPQIDRMLADDKSGRFVGNFVGQWLQTRDVETVNIDPRRILGTRDSSKANRVFNRNVRRAMREETEMMFGYLVRENRSALELLDSDYTFLNRDLAGFYGIDGVKNSRMEKVQLPADSHRGSLLTHASFLVVTSNPTRTSPVKRGLFILENLLGTPPPPAPPNVPQLEEITRSNRGKLTMREALAMHREKPLCASCHERFDPLGLALENFNALGQWRDEENGHPIQTDGQLITGEKFNSARELGRILATQRPTDFYRCLTEKLLTFAIGRGMEYYDTPTIDRIVEGMKNSNGEMRGLIYAVVESTPFQKRRGDGDRLLGVR